MVTNEELIQQQRRQWQDLQAKSQKEQFSKAQLLQKQTGLAARAQRQAQAQRQKQIVSPQKQAEQEQQKVKKDTISKLEARIKEATAAKAKFPKRDLTRINEQSAIIKEAQRILTKVREGEILVTAGAALSRVQAIGEQAFKSGTAKQKYKERVAKFEAQQKDLPATQQPGVTPQVREGVATYDPSTHTYTSSKGVQSSMALEDIPRGTQLTQSYTASGGPLLPSYPQFQLDMPVITTPQFQASVQQYKDMGFTQVQAERVAIESQKQMVDFTKEGAKQIARRTIPEKVGGEIKDIGRFYYETGVKGVKKIIPTVSTVIEFTEPYVKSFKEQEVKIKLGPTPPGIGPLYQYDTGVTYGEAVTLPKRGRDFVAEEIVKEGWEYGYDTTVALLPEKFKPELIKPGKIKEYQEEVMKIARGEKEYDSETFKELTIPLRGETVGRVAGGTFKLGTYGVPVVGGVVLASEFASGVQQVWEPEAKAGQVIEEMWGQYQEDVKEARLELQPGYELETTLTKEDFTAQYMPEVIQQVKVSGATEAALTGAFLGGIGAIKVYQFGKPFTKVTPTRALKEKAFIEIKEKPIITPEGRIAYTKIKTIGEKRPPLIKEETTRFRELFGMEPLATKELPAIEITQVSHLPFGKGYVDPTKPYAVLEKETGKKYATFLSVSEGGAPRNLEAYMKLPSREKKLWRERVEEKLGHAFPEKLVPKFFKEEAKLIKGESVTEKLFRFKGDKKLMEISIPWKEGKRITQAESLLEIIPVKGKLPPLKDKIELIDLAEKVKKYKLDIVTLPTTKPLGRVTAKVDRMTGIYTEAKPIDLTLGKTYGVQPAQIKKTPLTDMFQVQEVKQVLDIKLPARPKPSKIPKALEVVIKPTPLPYMVGGVGLETIPYAGEATYEVTDMAVTRMAPIKEYAIVDIKPTFKTLEAQIPFVDTRFQMKVEEVPKLKIMQEVTPQLREDLVIVQLPVSRVDTKISQLPMVKERLRPAQALKLRQAFKPIQVPRVGVRPKPRPPLPKPKPKIKFIPPRVTRNKLVPRGPRLKLEVPQRGYNFEVRRKGKWERHKTPYAFATKAGAEATAQNVVLKEAAASYRVIKAKKGKKVVKSGKKVSPFRSFLFRPGKEPGVKVQKKLLRILTPGEKKEISYAGGIAKMKKAKLTFKNIPKKKKKGGKKK